MVVAGCDEAFEPIAPTDLQFSVFGYLDASADTQWIRVMPIRPLRLTSPEPLGATVTLEPLGTGVATELRDSVFRFIDHLDPELGSEGTYVHNFWTTERIEPGGAYRFTASWDGEEPAEAVVAVPEDYAVEVWLAQYWDESDYLRLTGVEHVPFLSANAHFFDLCGAGVDSTLYDGGSAEDEVHMIPIAPPGVMPRGDNCGLPTIEKRELWVVGSESEWPSGEGYAPGRLAVPEAPSNLTNALGFIGGVLTRVIPYEDCGFDSGDGAPVPDHCRLRYDHESATLGGTVTETRCGDGAIDSVTVQLRELDRAPVRVRTTFTTRDGAYEIGALEPAVRYSMRVRAPPEPVFGEGEIDVYTVHTDTVEFTPGEQASYDVRLHRLTDCGSQP